MGYALVIDSIDYSLWVMFLLWVIQLAPKFNKWTKADTSKLDEVSSRLEEEAKLNTKPITFQSLILLLGSVFLVSAIATLIAAVTPLGKVAGSGEVSSLLLYAVIGLLASRASLLELGEAPAWIATGFIVLGILMALMGYVVGTPLAVVCAHIMESLA